MKVEILMQKKEMKVITINLCHDFDDPFNERVNAFHCPNCGELIGQYLGQLFSIEPGAPAVRLPSPILYCKRCKRRYIINSII